MIEDTVIIIRIIFVITIMNTVNILVSIMIIINTITHGALQAAVKRRAQQLEGLYNISVASDEL